MSQNFCHALKKKKLRKDKKKNEYYIKYDRVVRKYCFSVFTALRFPYVILCSNLMTVQSSKGKVPCIYKEIIRGIMTFEYKNLLLLKSTQNKVASNIVATKQNKASQAYDICQEHFEIKLLVLQTSQ